MRAFTVLVIGAALSLVAHTAAADDGAMDNRAKLESARGALRSMRESYVYVLRKEEQARSAREAVLLNTLHQISTRINDLLSFADHALDDMRVAISSNEPPEAVDAELEKILLAKTKVDQARAEADRSVGIKLLTSETGDGTYRTMISESEALTLAADTIPLPTGEGDNVPPAAPQTRPAASPAY